MTKDEKSEESVDASEASEAAIQSEEKEQAEDKAKATGKKVEEKADSRDSGRSGYDREMHKAKCAECGKVAEVPFKPSGDKPVYCQDCYKKRRPPRRSFGGGDRGFNRDRSFGGERQMHKATCAGCGKEAEVPFKPNGKKPVYCKECFMKRKE